MKSTTLKWSPNAELWLSNTGMAGLGEWIHGQETSPGSGDYLRYGLYTCRGTCQCGTDKYSGPGSQGYEAQDVDWMAARGMGERRGSPFVLSPTEPLYPVSLTCPARLAQGRLVLREPRPCDSLCRVRPLPRRSQCNRAARPLQPLRVGLLMRCCMHLAYHFRVFYATPPRAPFLGTPQHAPAGTPGTRRLTRRSITRAARRSAIRGASMATAAAGPPSRRPSTPWRRSPTGRAPEGAAR